MKTGLGIALVAAAAFIPFSARAADYAPIDCAKAAAPAEIAICRNYSLGQAEARLATLFGITTSLVAMGQRGDIGDAQKQFLKTRDACGADLSCLAEAYRKRIAALDQVMANIAARGPF